MPTLKTPQALFKPKEGLRASLYNEEEDYFYDVIVKQIYRRGKLARVAPLDAGKEFEVETLALDAPLEPTVNERFEFFKDLSNMVMQKELKSLFVTGEGGIGKTYTINSMIAAEELEEDEDYVKIKGHCTPRALFNTIKEHQDKLLIFDDCDSILRDPTSENIIKAIIDTYDKRIVKWLSRDREERVLFTGSVIFLSNMNRDKVDQAILSRSIMVDLYMTPKEKIERMTYILPTMKEAPGLSMTDKWEVLNLIDRYKNTLQDLNLRTLIKAMLIFEKKRSLNLVKYQILNG
jgi:hypothetical protein